MVSISAVLSDDDNSLCATATPTITADFETGGPDVKNVLGPDDHLNEKRSRSSGEVDVIGPVTVDTLTYGDEDGRLPTDEERATLRLVAGCVYFDSLDHGLRGQGMAQSALD